MKSRLLGLAAMAALIPAGVQAAAVSTKFADVEQQAATATIWTKEAIANAPAMAMPVDAGTAVPFEGRTQAVSGSPSMTAPGVASADAEAVARAAYPEDWEVLEAATSSRSNIQPQGTPGTSWPYTYTYFDVNYRSELWQTYPNIWMGKLTFNTLSGSASCSATAISGNNIVTAAHCVYDTTNNVWHSNMAFTPAYRNGSAPYGTFPYSACTILTSWISRTGSYSIKGWAPYDVAVCTMGTNDLGQTLNTAVGWSGRLWNASYKQLNFNSGYPAQDYNGSAISTGPGMYQRACVNESFQPSSVVSGITIPWSNVVGGGCYWGRGISGGSWLVGWQPFMVGGWVNSVNSGLYIGKQNIYGARFNSNNIVPLCTARGC